MVNKYFDIEDTLYDITGKYPETIELLVGIGFDSLKDEKLRESIGKKISLQMALNMKKLNVQTFEEKLIESINLNRVNVDKSLIIKEKTENPDIKIEGVLPCPVRIPLLEGFNKWMEDKGNSLNLKVDYELKAASMGVDFIKQNIEKAESEEELSDIFISAGFDLFFDKKLLGKFKEKGIFEDLTGFERLNKDFDNNEISLKDPDGQYSMIGVVPAVFLVNTEELGELKVPSSWEDILKPEFENKVSLPIGDFDLFNSILLNIYKKYGEDGVRRLGKSLLRSMHPSEMVKSYVKKGEKPVVTIMPYFFTKMTKRGGPMQAVWPKDGAIISPIFMLSKKSKKEMIQPFIDFFSSKEVGEILSYNGKFPTVNPEVDNMISSEHKYMWLGWDFIKQNDIAKLIKDLEKCFNESVYNAKI